MDVSIFREVQSKLAEHSNGDRSIVNESRVMRLPNFYHCKEERVLVECIKYNPEAYSWVKSPRYNNLPFETGHLARQWLSGEYRNGISIMDRTIARVLEARKIALVMNTLIENIIPGVSVQKEYSIPEAAVGNGLIDTTRGAPGHWLRINNQVISFYQIITPSAWNLSPRGNDSLRGTAEQALFGTSIQDTENPVELGRIIPSFDPCVSCATHVYT